MHSYTVTILTAECIQVNTYLWSARVLSVNPVTITIIVAYAPVSEVAPLFLHSLKPEFSAGSKIYRIGSEGSQLRRTVSEESENKRTSLYAVSIIQLFHGCLMNSQNYSPEVLTIRQTSMK